MLALDAERQKEKRRRLVAFILSLFIPGLGQLSRKRISSGIFFLFTFAFILWLVFELKRVNYGLIGTFIGLFFLYCCNLLDAYKGPMRHSAPCERKCPAGINIPLYIALMKKGRYNDALTTIMDRMPLPAACGRICHHPCESVCALRIKEGSVAIEWLKRAAADFGNPSVRQNHQQKNSASIGIIGGGPAGLSAAYFLARRGYSVTVYEREAEPGGLLRWAIPTFRLPERVVTQEISLLKQFDIKIKCGITIGKEMHFNELRKQHGALLIAAGSSVSKSLALPGIDLEGIHYALPTLKKVHHGVPFHLKGDIVVIGGGNTAFDAARTAIRSGAKIVTIYYRRNAEEMPGNPEELTMALREGVTIEYHAAPVRFIGEGRVSADEFIRTELKEVDGESLSEVAPIDGSRFSVPCNNVLIATGQKPDFDFLPEDLRSKIVEGESLRINTVTMQTPLRGIFAAGDVTGRTPKTVVDAVETGRKAARGIDWFLRGVNGFGRMLERITSFDYPLPEGIRKSRITGKRQEQALIDTHRAHNSFDEVECGLSKEQAEKEALRCLQCNRL